MAYGGRSSRWRSVLPTALLASFAAGCEAPYLARDGTVVFPENGARGAAVLTANGVEFHDRANVPDRIVRRDANEPWRAPLGFILPKSGRFTQTSQATILTTPGLAVVLRPSDTRVPTWGGEILVRLEVIAPAAPDEARAPERIAFVVDGTEEAHDLALAAFDTLSAQDRITVIDGAGNVLVPPVPGRYRTLAGAAIDKYVGEAHATDRVSAPRRALASAKSQLDRAGGAPDAVRRIVFMSNASDRAWSDTALQTDVEHLAGEGTRISFVGASPSANASVLGGLAMAGAGIGGTSSRLEDRLAAMRRAIPPSGDTRFRDMVVSFSGVPAPSQVLEASAGDVRWGLDAFDVALGDVSIGEARAEVLRVTVPPGVPGEAFDLHVEARFVDGTNTPRALGTDLHAKFDQDIERIADSRAGDVIAFASALATLKRLEGAFAGSGVDSASGLRALATLHARSMSFLARDTKDPAIREQAEVLNALLAH